MNSKEHNEKEEFKNENKTLQNGNEQAQSQNKQPKNRYWSSLIAGGLSSVLMVATFYPLDTLKTRMQAAEGFERAGGYRGLYKGFFLLIIFGTIPINCFFYGSYEALKSYGEEYVRPQYHPVLHMSTACFCRVLASIIRVPAEILKQRNQAEELGPKNIKGFSVLVEAYRQEGIRRGLFRGLSSTMMRDVPFTFIEMPIWELLKKTVAESNNKQITPFQSGICGLAAGIIAGTFTTPLDVAKTRIILANKKVASKTRNICIRSVLRTVYMESGIRGLFTGYSLRIFMVMMGRFMFYSFYEEIRLLVEFYLYGG